MTFRPLRIEIINLLCHSLNAGLVESICLILFKDLFFLHFVLILVLSFLYIYLSVNDILYSCKFINKMYLVNR